MDNVTHGLIGYSIYAGLKNEEMEKEKKWYIAAAVLGAELPDLDAITRFWGNDVYLVWHRNFTRSIFFSPIMALLVVGILYLVGRKKFVVEKDVSSCFSCRLFALVVRLYELLGNRTCWNRLFMSDIP